VKTLNDAEEAASAKPAPNNTFLHVLQHHEEGEVLNQLAEAQRECRAAAELTGKVASLTLVVKFKAAARGATAIMIAPVKVKLPEAEPGASLWFSDEEGNLHRNDPRQKELPLKTVEDPAKRPVIELPKQKTV
jgi:hypothetical protein